jgi:hypothetical protein
VLNLPLEMPNKPAWRGILPSSAIHALVLIVFTQGSPLTKTVNEPRTNQLRHAVPLFVPAPETARQQAARVPSLNWTRHDPTVAAEAEANPVNVSVNMNSIQLSFAKDFTNQLPGVVEAYAGALALIDKRDPAFARYLIEPPDWTVRETLQDISGKVKVEMYPPREWRVLRAVASRYSLALDRYQVCALFETSFNHCLQNAIRAKARSQSHGGAVVVRSARLAFSVGSPCGVDVLEVGFAPAVARRPPW